MNFSKIYTLIQKGQIAKTLNALEQIVGGKSNEEVQQIKAEWKKNKTEILSDPLKKTAFITHLLSLIKKLEEKYPEVPKMEENSSLPVSIEKLLEGLNPDVFEGLNLKELNLSNLDLSLNEKELNRNPGKEILLGKNTLSWMNTYDILKERVIAPAEGPATAGDEPPEAEEELPVGVLLHCIPRKMQVGTAHRCIIRIAQDEKKVRIGLPDYAENEELREIEISEEMEVTFIPTHHFEITPINSAKQKILKKYHTEWNFDVTPKSTGTFPLNFVVSVIYYEDGEQKREVTLTERVMVSTEPVASTLEYVPSSPKPYEPEAKPFPVLMLTANPAGTTQLNLDKEHSRIAEKLQNHPLYFPLIVKRAVDKVTFREEIIEEKPGFLHFSGHGTLPETGTGSSAHQGGIVLQNEEHNGYEQISTEALGILFEYFKEEGVPLQAVILNACFSEEQACAIAAYVPYVIGTTQNIKDTHAIAFSVGFYFRLMENYPGTDIEMAFKSGRTSAVLEGAPKHSFVIYKDGMKVSG